MVVDLDPIVALPSAQSFPEALRHHLDAIGGYRWGESDLGEEFAGISRRAAPDWPGWRSIDYAKLRVQEDGESFPDNVHESNLLKLLVDAFYAGAYPWDFVPMPVLATLVIKGQVISKKNTKEMRLNPRTGTYFPASSKAYDAWEAQALYQLRGYCGRTILGPVSIVVDIWRRTLHDYDVDNMGTSVLDALVAAEILTKDTATVVPWFLSRHAGKDAENPRATITIIDGADGPPGELP